MTPVIIMIEVKKSPYVMYINNTPFRKTRNGIESRLFGCLGEYIIFETPTVGAGAGF